MNLFLKIVASLPILIYFIIIRPTVQNESWDSEQAPMDMSRFLSTMMGLEDKINFSSFTKPSLNFTKPDDFGSDGSKPDIGPSAYNFLTSFVNQTRSTIPLLAHHGNFTLIQAALLFTIGCMAAGAATVVLEGLAFRQRETEIELYKKLKDHHHDAMSGVYGPPSPSYGPPSSYGYNQGHDSYSSAHSEPIPSYASVPASYSSSNSDPFSSYYGVSSSSRKKRDTGQQLADGNFLQLSKPYRRNTYNRPGNGFYPRFQSSSGLKISHRDRKPISFTGAGSTSTSSFNGIGLAGSSSQQITGYPEPNNYLMLNRLGMKRKHYGSQKRRVQNLGDDDDDDEMEYARGILDEMATNPVRTQRPRKRKRIQDPEQQVNGYIMGDGMAFNIPSRNRMRKYWKNVSRKR